MSPGWRERWFQTDARQRLRLRCRLEEARALPATPSPLPARPDVGIASDA
jgi:hypothetical protein